MAMLGSRGAALLREVDCAPSDRTARAGSVMLRPYNEDLVRQILDEVDEHHRSMVSLVSVQQDGDAGEGTAPDGGGDGAGDGAGDGDGGGPGGPETYGRHGPPRAPPSAPPEQEGAARVHVRRRARARPPAPDGRPVTSLRRRRRRRRATD